MLSVRKVLQIAPMNRGELLAGRTSIDHEIKSATVIEIPYMSNFLEPGLAAITSFYAISNDLEKQKSTLKILAKHQTAAVFLFNVGSTNGILYLPDELIDLCNELELPLIKMPLDISYDSVYRELTNQLLNQEEELLQKMIRIYELCTFYLLDIDKKPSEFLYKLSEEIQKPIYFFNSKQIFFNFDSTNENKQSPDVITKKLIINLPTNSFSSSYHNIDDISYLYIPLVKNKKYCGCVIIKGIISSSSKYSKSLINLLQEVLPVSILSAENFDEYIEQIKNKFLSDLLIGIVNDRDNILEQSRNLSLKLSEIDQLVVIYPKTSPHTWHDFYKKVSKISKIIFDDALYVNNKTDQSLIIMLKRHSYSDTNELHKKLADLLDQLQTNALESYIVLSKKIEDVMLISVNYKRAWETAYVATLTLCQTSVLLSGDLDLYSLLYQYIPPEEARKMTDRYLHEIRSYDLDNHTDLEQTLMALIQYDLNTKNVSEQLYIHANTVLQRKNRIIKILGEDPFSTTNRIKYTLIFLFRNLFDW